MYANDVASYNKLTLPNPLRSRLTSGGRVNENGLRELAAVLCLDGTVSQPLTPKVQQR
jgi:hypothetical protein